MRQMILILILFNCLMLQAKIVEKKGNPRIKKMTQPQTNTYIGISQPLSTLQSAIDNAVSHAQNQIIQNLGVKAQIDIQFEDYQFSRDNQENSQSVFSKRSNISGVYALKIKADQFYWEHHQTKKEDYYLAFVVVNFSKNEYIEHVESAYENMSDKISEVFSDSDPTIVLQKMIRLNSVLNEFESEYAHLKQIVAEDIYSDFTQQQKRYMDQLKEFAEHLKIERINKDERFPKQIYVYVTFNDQPLKNFPMNVKTHNFNQIPTDDEGFILIFPDYTKFIRQESEIAFSTKLIKGIELPKDQFTLISPLYNQNITIQLDVSSEHYSEELIDDILTNLNRKQFKVISSSLPYTNQQTMADYILKVSVTTKYLAQESKVNHYVYETQMDIQLINAKNMIVEKWQYPNRDFGNMRFIAESKIRAKQKSLSLIDYPKKNELWFSLMIQIEQAIKRKNVKAE